MDWERARKPEQIEVRRKAILDAALEMFFEMDYEKISLNGIARRAGFSKPNVYRYFSTREEIFLVLFARAQEQFTTSLIERLSKVRSKDPVSRLADLWVEETLKCPLLLKLLPQLMTSLEKNSSVEQIASFKKQSTQLFMNLVQTVCRCLPDLDPDGSMLFVQSAIALTCGVWPMTTPSDNVLKAMEIAGMDPNDWQYKTLMKKSLVALLIGLTSNQEN